MKVQMTGLDAYAFIGRSFHPVNADIGREFYVVAMRIGWMTPDGCAYEADQEWDEMDGKKLLWGAACDARYDVYCCVATDGSGDKRELMGHEISFL